MYPTEYDLIVAEDRGRELQNEMKAIRLGQIARAERMEQPSLLDRLVALTSRGAHIHVSDRKAGAAA
jgi:hypothetical protein